MLSALGAAILWVGSALDFLDLTVACAASLICVFAVIELGMRCAWSIYGVTALLALLIVPVKLTAFEYAVFAGIYPIIKYYIERRTRRAAVAWAFKLGYAFVSVVGTVAFARVLLFTVEPLPLLILTAVLGMAAFVLYDFALTRFISLYHYRWRKRLRIGRWLK